MSINVQRFAYCGMLWLSLLFIIEKCSVVDGFTVPLPTIVSSARWFIERDIHSRSESLQIQRPSPSAISSSSSSNAAVTTDTTQDAWERQVTKLKKVLQREYVSFFDPMETQYYDVNVCFTDPLNDLAGVKAYQNNVEMLSGRTLFGKLLFSDAYIQLHSVTGGQVTVNNENVQIQDIVTRWTLGFTFSILPWKPSPRFTGISVYKVRADSQDGCVKIVSQTDYWDSINLDPISGEYLAVDRNQAVSYFLSLLSPQTSVGPAAAGPELPYEILRITDTYEVRRYPAYVGLQIEYQRRDEAYAELGSYTSANNIQPLAPAIVEISTTTDTKEETPKQQKTMHWPLRFAMPGDTSSPMSSLPASFVQQIQSTTGVEFMEVPSQVVAIQRFGGPIVERTVQNIREQLCQSLRNHRLPIPTEFDTTVANDGEQKKLQFAQYDAIFSVGQRRSEVRIPLSHTEEHPWSGNGIL